MQKRTSWCRRAGTERPHEPSRVTAQFTQDGRVVSFPAIRWALSKRLKPSQKLTLIALADRADIDSHSCYPSIPRIEADTGLHRETIFAAIRELEKARLVAVDRRIGKGHRYQLSVDVMHDHTEISDQYGKPDGTSPEIRTPGSTENRTPTSTENRTHNLCIEPVIEPINKPGARQPTKTTQLYTVDFEAAWGLYPAREGGNSKSDAFKAWRARTREGYTSEQLTGGVRRYASYCDVSGSVGTRFVKQAATFFGPALSFLEPWTAALNGKKKGRAADVGLAAKDYSIGLPA